MAEFCYECLKKEFGVNPPVENVVLSNDLDLCEGCMEYKRVVVAVHKTSFIKKLLLKLKAQNQPKEF